MNRYPPAHIPRAAGVRGFTLIELLLVLAILAILTAVTIIAINPAQRLATARDAQRMGDVYAIHNALQQYASNNEGSLPTEITTEERELCRTGSVSCTGMYDLSTLTDGERYLSSLPIDPSCPARNSECNDSGTGYAVSQTANGRVTVSAPRSETDEISVTR